MGVIKYKEVIIISGYIYLAVLCEEGGHLKTQLLDLMTTARPPPPLHNCP